MLKIARMISAISNFNCKLLKDIEWYDIDNEFTWIHQTRKTFRSFSELIMWCDMNSVLIVDWLTYEVSLAMRYNSLVMRNYFDSTQVQMRRNNENKRIFRYALMGY